MTHRTRRLAWSFFALALALALSSRLFNSYAGEPAGRNETSAESARANTAQPSASANSARAKSGSADDDVEGEAPGKPREITFDTLKFAMEQGSKFKRAMLGDKIEKIDSRVVRVRGYMLPSFQQTGLKNFVLVRDNMECCFGPKAALYDCIVVDMTGDATTDYTIRPIAVEGKFTIDELKLGGRTLAIYHLDAALVK